MGFFDDYDVDLTQFNDSGFDVPDGLYDFEVVGAETRKGTSKDEDAVHIVISYRLENVDGEVYSTNSWFKVPTDPDHPTQRESIAMTELKKLLLSAGVAEEDLATAGPDDLEGLTGTLRLVTTTNRKGNTFQNVRNVEFDGVGDDEEPVVEKPKSQPKQAAQPKPTKDNPFKR